MYENSAGAARFSAGGFDPARDIQAITVNRWPHGYGLRIQPIVRTAGPAGIGASRVVIGPPAPFGRNQNCELRCGTAMPTTNTAIDQGYRAVA